jgi:hypothetical protein
VLNKAVQEFLILSGLLLLVLDRTIVLAAIRTKAIKALSRRRVLLTWRVATILGRFVNLYATLAMSVLLLCFLSLGLMQVFSREALSNDVGRALFGLYGFVLSVGGSLLNICVERLEMKP